MLNNKSIGERFELMLNGLNDQFINETFYPFLILLIIGNLVYLKLSKKTSNSQLLKSLAIWGLLFCVLYIILLPFGGYRQYRPNILRYDTVMPVTIFVFIMLTASSLYVLNRLKGNFKLAYLLILAFVCLHLSIKDHYINYKRHSCEVEAIQKIANSPEEVVPIDANCHVISWGRYKNPEQTRLQGILLTHWNILESPKKYYFLNKD